MKITNAIDIQTASGETMLGYRNARGQVVTITGKREKVEKTFHEMLSSEFEKQAEK